MSRTWPAVPGVPAAGHVTSGGHWHPGRAEGCPKCPQPLTCLDRGPDCEGDVELRMPLSGTGRSFPRCARHWEQRLEVQRGIDERYPTHPPSDWSPLDAGESWYEDE